jgi:RinA family phage transcriptional activator
MNAPPAVRRPLRPRGALRGETFRYLEAELRDYNTTKARLVDLTREITERGMGIAYDAQRADQAASSEWSDPTPKRAGALAANPHLLRLRAVVNGIEAVLERLPERWRRLVEVYYFERWPHDRIEAELAAADRTTRDWRRAVVTALAEELGEW